MAAADSKCLPRLLALTPGELCAAEIPRFLSNLERCLDAGLPGLLLREPQLMDGALWELLEAVLAVRERCGAELWLAVHDRLHLGLLSDCDALHLGWSSLRPAVARELIGTRRQLGFSSHRGDDPEVLAPCDYLFHSPVRATPSKPAVDVLGWDEFQRFAASSDVPTYALGGMSVADGERAVEAGGHGVAVLSGILGAADPAGAVQRYLECLPT